MLDVLPIRKHEAPELQQNLDVLFQRRPGAHLVHKEKIRINIRKMDGQPQRIQLLPGGPSYRVHLVRAEEVQRAGVDALAQRVLGQRFREDVTLQQRHAAVEQSEAGSGRAHMPRHGSRSAPNLKTWVKVKISTICLVL